MTRWQRTCRQHRQGPRRGGPQKAAAAGLMHLRWKRRLQGRWRCSLAWEQPGAAASRRRLGGQPMHCRSPGSSPRGAAHGLGCGAQLAVQEHRAALANPTTPHPHLDIVLLGQGLHVSASGADVEAQDLGSQRYRQLDV